jgi:hypothetical protein
MRKLIIERSRWIRGEFYPDETNVDLTFLWNQAKDCGCCLGHYLNKLEGVNLFQLDGFGEPNELNMDCDLVYRHDIDYDMIYSDNKFAVEAMFINDDTSITDETREENLIELFASQDIELEFV